VKYAETQLAELIALHAFAHAAINKANERDSFWYRFILPSSGLCTLRKSQEAKCQNWKMKYSSNPWAAKASP